MITILSCLWNPTAWLPHRVFRVHRHRCGLRRLRRSLASLFAIVLLSQLIQCAYASDVRVRNVNLTQSGEPDEYLISFDVGWDGSWRHATYWDAAWVFVKHKARHDLAADGVLQALESLKLDRGLIGPLDRGIVPQGVDFLLRRKGVDIRDVTVKPIVSGKRWKIEVQRHGIWRRGLFRETFLLEQADGGSLAASVVRWAHVDVVGHSAPPEATVENVADKKGVFIFRSDQGEGPVSFRNVELRAKLDPDGVIGKRIDIWVFAIEMVHIPKGPFWVGDPRCQQKNGPEGCFYDYSKRNNKDGSINTAYKIETEDVEIPVCEDGDGDVAPLCYGTSHTGEAGDGEGPIPSTFPKGVEAFYAMKYELTQQQYSDFLNTLTTSIFALQNRFPYVGSGGQEGSRLTLFYTPSGGWTQALQPSRAYNWVAWVDNAAYMDWAALRPMTELEFEKVSRGTVDPRPREYAWGSSSYLNPAGRIAGPELPFESPSVNGNVNIGTNTFIGGEGGQGPVAGDAFELPRGQFHDAILPSGAATFELQTPLAGQSPGPSDAKPLKLKKSSLPFGLEERAVEGRSYYGLMNLSGNLWEMTISVGSKEGREFQACHGDGEVTTSGAADVPTWPSRGALGIGFRGGSWLAGPSSGQVANRYQAANAYPVRSPDFGLRAVRSVSDSIPDACSTN